MIVLKSFERAYLRSLGEGISPVVMVGKDGVCDSVSNALIGALDAHELVKVRFQSHKDEIKALSEELAAKTDSTLVAVTGFTVLYYKQSSKEEKRHIFLPKREKK